MNLIKELSVKNILFLTLAGIINATGVTIFLAPVGLIDSGLSGTSLLLDSLTPTYLTLSLFLVVLNFPFYFMAYKKIGLKFLVYSLYAIAIYSLMSMVYQDILPIDFSQGSPIVGSDRLLASIFGGLISGLGSGLVIRFGGAIDGVEVLAVMFAKKLNLTVGTFVMLYNLVIYVIAALITGNWLIPLYSVIAYYVGLKTVDFVVEGIDKGIAAFIITDNAKGVSNKISNELQRSVTILDGRGYYSKQKKEIVYVVVNRFELPILKRILSEEQTQSFVSFFEVTETLGTKIKYKVNYKTEALDLHTVINQIEEKYVSK